ncbi:MAG: tRNA (N6-isopentenyl adenosine(37)-C2)-methylthiotransferase MiaB [Chitinivibrionales bacterium]|nr:tRNA (N6-isopentenyl adenosine(37)-C2)-methylthiotransferase MiaB [Chitinivibrionales bacterium]MBD3396731.1 tRNA (N6-isopentenyl adenosine(37)-C2)-methylthiotransferase MiaB [Chitinivibrionales bacterium]
MSSYHIETFGCQMNVADSDMLAGLLEMRGFTRADHSDSANLLVVNTCSVREHAERRARARITEYANRKASRNPRQRLWVIGCMAERLGDRLREHIPGIDRIIGATRVEHLAHDLDALLEELHADTGPREPQAPGVTAFLPVMRGCDNYCSYCVVPFVRGREHSVPSGDVVTRARDLAARGVRELTLLGQNVNSYRDGALDFPDLLTRVHDIESIHRLRFTTSHPKDCTEKLIRTMASLKKVCNHVHLPVQSGSTRVLARMNRRYTREEYRGRIETIRAHMPDADITTDVMVGFPGETEEDFKQTLSLFENVRFTAAFMFAYSDRERTAAASMDGRVAETVKKRRLEELISLQTGITKEHYAAMVGRTVSVLFTRRQDGRDRGWIGQDHGAKRVLVRCDDPLAGTILPVTVSRSSGMTLCAERVSP